MEEGGGRGQSGDCRPGPDPREQGLVGLSMCLAWFHLLRMRCTFACKISWRPLSVEGVIFFFVKQRMKLPGLPLEQDNENGMGELCGWWAIGKECVRTGIYPPRTRNLAGRVMAHVATHAADNIQEEMFTGVWKAWKSSKQQDITLEDYVTTLLDHPQTRIGDGCSDADLMIATHWLHHTTPANSDQLRLFTYREGDDGYKQYCMGRVFINTPASEVRHETDLILCNRSSIHWTATRPIEERKYPNGLK
jgi:hypothetical protein